MSDSDPPQDDAALAQRIRSGDRDALGELYDRYASVALATVKARPGQTGAGFG